MKRILLLTLAAVMLSLPLAAQDVLTIGNTSVAAGGMVRVAVHLRDVSGTPLGSDAGAGNRIQGVSLLVRVTSPYSLPLTFETAGALRVSTALYEAVTPTLDGVGYIGAFPASTPLPFTLNGAAPGDRIATLRVTVPQAAAEGTVYAIGFDGKLTMLANEAATVFESQANGKLKLVAGTVTVGGAVTTTAVSSSANPSNAGSPVTFTASVTSQTAGTIGGTVAFLDGQNVLGFGTLQNGSASLTTSALTAGSHSITAIYEGSTAYRTSTSAPITQTVNISLTAPANFVATAASATRVTLSWSAVANATSYEIRRSANNSAFAVVASTAATTINDDTVSPNTTYIYVVRALGPGGATSPDSAKDAATTVVFADDPLSTGVTVKLAHLVSLRTTVNAFRASAGLAAFSFTDPSPTTATVVKKVHIEELRTALSAARTAAGLPAVSFTDPTLTTSSKVKAVHVQELRNGVK